MNLDGLDVGLSTEELFLTDVVLADPHVHVPPGGDVFEAVGRGEDVLSGDQDPATEAGALIPAHQSHHEGEVPPRLLPIIDQGLETAYTSTFPPLLWQI